MNRTTNYDFEKPETTEYYDIGQQNDNWDKADAAIKEVGDSAASDLSTATAAFNASIAALQTNLQTQITALQRHVVTTAGTDLNDYTTVGTYFFSNSVTPDNVPIGTNGTLIVFSQQTSETNMDFLKQIWLRSGTPGTNSYQIFERSHSSTDGWSSWVRFITTSDLTGALTTILSSDLTANRVLVSSASGKVAASDILPSELAALDNVSGNIQTQLNAKQAAVTGAASTVVSSNLDASRAVISNGSGKLAASSVTQSELYQLSGINTDQTVQTQINSKQTQIEALQTAVAGKADASHTSVVGTSSVFGHVKIANNLSTGSFSASNPVALSAYQGNILYNLIAAANQAAMAHASNFSETVINAAARSTIQWSDTIDNDYFKREASGRITFKTAGTYLILAKCAFAKNVSSAAYAEAVLQYRDWDSSTGAWSTTYNELGNFVSYGSVNSFETLTDFHLITTTGSIAKIFNLYAKDNAIKVNAFKMLIIKLS